MKNNSLFPLLILLGVMNSCSIRHFTEEQYDVLGTLYKVTGEEKSPLVGFLPHKMSEKQRMSKSEDQIMDVKIFVGKYPECQVENGNTRGYTLNLDPENNPCVSPAVGYHKFRWVELTSQNNRKIYFLLSEKIIKDSIYERSKIFYYSDSTETFRKEHGGYHFNREVRVFKGMLSGKVKSSRNAKEHYIVHVNQHDDDHRFIRKIVSNKSNKISGTKPLVFDLPDLLFENPENGGIKLVYHDASSKLTLNLLKKEDYRMKK
ncbi:MAG: hypothetical protein IPM48_02495 [Saprospiraceae bacterium]|nr:hypothetical protein [Saprospiraceae bacterium]